MAPSIRIGVTCNHDLVGLWLTSDFETRFDDRRATQRKSVEGQRAKHIPCWEFIGVGVNNKIPRNVEYGTGFFRHKLSGSAGGRGRQHGRGRIKVLATALRQPLDG